MATTTNRLGLVIPGTGDTSAELRIATAANATILDHVATTLSGTIGALPAAGLAGRRYYATDSAIELYDTGTAWLPVGTFTPIGTVVHWAGASDPVDPGGVTRWMICDGRAIDRTAFSSLFTTIGTSYGVGNNSTTFNIPDGRARALVGAGPQTGCTTRTVAQTGGEETHTLSNGEMPLHSHGGATGVDSPDHAHGISDAGHAHALNTSASSATFNFGNQESAVGLGSDSATIQGTGISIGGATARHAHGIGNDGGGGSHINMQPFLVVNRIIKVL